MIKYISFICLFLVLFCASCDRPSGPVSDGAVNEGTRKTYRKNGELLSEANYKSGKLHGVSKNFYLNGNVHNLITYKDGVKDGLVQTYYKNGILNRETTYKEGKMHGYQKKFFKDGKLSSEQNYKDDYPGALKEFSSNGKPITKFPELVITPMNNINATGEYILEVTFSENGGRALYYDGDLIDGEFFDEANVLRLAQRQGVAQMRIKVNKGEVINETVNIIGVLKTPRRNQYIIQKEYKVKVKG